MINVLALLLGAGLVLGSLWLLVWTLGVETACFLLVYGGFAVGFIVPPVAILWMAFA